MKPILALVFIHLLGGIFAYALPSDANAPIRLLADKANYSAQAGQVVYSGNVSITQGTLKMTASNLTVNLNANNSIAQATAKGSPATVEQVITQAKGKAQGRANSIDYRANQGQVIMTGNAHLNQAGASFSGNTIRYSLKTGDVEAQGSGNKQVEIVFPPQGTANLVSLR